MRNAESKRNAASSPPLYSAFSIPHSAFSSMSIKCDEYGNVCVIALDGDLAGGDVREVRKAVEERIAARGAGAGFVIDLERSQFISSQGLEALLDVRRRCEDRRGRLVLA